MPPFGEMRLLRQTPLPERLLYRAMGVADPAHWLHFRYLKNALDGWPSLVPEHILDAGSGRGDHTLYLARRYPNAKVLGVDVDPSRVDKATGIAKKLGITNVEFRIGDLVTANFGSPFDLIVSIDVLEHIVEQEAAIRNLSANMAPDGKFFFHIPTVREKPVLLSTKLKSFHEWAEHEHVAEDRTAEQFADVVKRAGLDVANVRRTFGRFTGELAVSVFSLAHRNTLMNKIVQAALAPACRVAAWSDTLSVDDTRYAVAVTGSKGQGRPSGRSATN